MASKIESIRIFRLKSYNDSPDLFSCNVNIGEREVSHNKATLGDVQIILGQLHERLERENLERQEKIASLLDDPKFPERPWPEGDLPVVASEQSEPVPRPGRSTDDDNPF